MGLSRSKAQKTFGSVLGRFFRNDILPVLPVASMAPFFSESFGRPSKELHTILGVLLLQQMLNLTDDETLDQLSYSIQWHYALNITEETDSAKYFCPKTLWNVRNIASTHNVDSKLFETITDSLVKKFEVDTDYQRLDSVHLKSNMRRLGRISIISNTIHKFLVNLKRQNPDAFGSVSTVLVERYVTPKAMVCFSRVKPSDSDKTLQSVSQDLYELEQQFKGDADVSKMHSYKLIERVFKEQCSVKTTDNVKVIEVVPQNPHDVPCDSVQNPSDPDASYCAHKGQGFKAQIMETFSPDKDSEKKGASFASSPMWKWKKPATAMPMPSFRQSHPHPKETSLQRKSRPILFTAEMPTGRPQKKTASTWYRRSRTHPAPWQAP